MDQIENRKKFIINVIYFVILFLIVVLVLQYAFYPLLPIFISLIVAVILQRPMNFICKKSKLPKGVVATFLVLVLLAIMVLGVYALGSKIVDEIQEFFIYIKDYLTDYNWIRSQVYGFVNSLPRFIYDNIIDTVNDVMSQLKVAMENDVASGSNDITFTSVDWSTITGTLTSGISTGVSGVLETAKQIPSILVAIIIGIILSCFMTIEYAEILEIIEGIIGPEKGEKFTKSRAVLKSAVGRLAKAYGILCCLTFAELAIGLTVLKVIGVYNGGYVIVISLITAILDILPVLGIGTIMWPWMAYAFFTRQTGMLIGLFVLYLIITVIRRIIEPKLVSDSLELPAAITLAVMYIGLKYFGVLGMFVFVLILYCAVALEKEGITNITNKKPKEISQPDEKPEEKSEEKSEEK